MNLRDAIIQSVQMLHRSGLPVSERLRRNGQECSAEEGRIRNNGSAEKEKLVSASHDKRSITGASIPPEPGKRPLAQLADEWLLSPPLCMTGIDRDVHCIL